MITYPPGSAWRRGPQTISENATEQALADWSLRSGKLQKVLQRNEYKILENAPIFESNFLQVTKKGEFIGIHNHPNIVTVGILASRPSLLLPDLMIIARAKKGVPGNKVPRAKDLEITRLIPLHLVEIFVHDVSDRRLKVQMVTGRTYYLKLCAPEKAESFLFERWMRLIYLLHIDSGRISTPASFTSRDSGLYTIWKSESLQAMSRKHWIPTLVDMNKEATEQLKEKLQQVYANRNQPRSMENETASKQNTLKPGFTHYAGPPGISTKEGYAFREQSRSSTPVMTNRSVARKSEEYKISSSISPKHSKSKKQAQSKNTSSHSAPQSRVSVGAQTSTSAPESRVMAVSRPRQTKDAEQSNLLRVENPRIPTASSESETVPIKLQRSKKNTSLVQNEDAALPAEANFDVSTKSPGKRPGPAEIKQPPSQGAGGSPASPLTEKQSHPAAGAALTAPPPPSPNWRSHTSGAAKPSEARDLPVTAGPSSAGTQLPAATPLRPASMGPQATRETPVTPPKIERRGRTYTAHPEGAKLKPWEFKRASSGRRQPSSSPSPEQRRSVSRSLSRKRRNTEVPLHRAMVSVAAGPSQPGWKSVAVGPSKIISMIPKSRASKSKEQGKQQIQPSSATGKQDQPRSQAPGSKGKLKRALSSARQRSSLTFVTIYSILSSSMEKLRAKSKEDIKEDGQEMKLSEGEEEQVTAKLSKRVTISGVVGPSGKSMMQQDTADINAIAVAADPRVQDNVSRTKEPGGPSGQTQQQNRIEDTQRPIAQPTAASGLPSKSCVSIGMGYSITETRSVGIECSMVVMASQEAGPSEPNSKAEPDSQANKAFKPQQFELVEITDKPTGKRVSKHRSSSKKKVSRRRHKSAAPRSTPRPTAGVQSWTPRKPPDRLANGGPWPPRNWSHSSYPMVLKLRGHKLRSEVKHKWI